MGSRAEGTVISFKYLQFIQLLCLILLGKEEKTCTYRGRRRVDDDPRTLGYISPLPPSRAKTSLLEGNRALGRRSMVQ